MHSIRKAMGRIERFFVYRVLHVDDTPHRLALGIALGMFIAWTPTIGFQMLLVLLLAPLIGANGRVGVPVVWISNPLTFVPIFYPNYLLGNYLVRLFAGHPTSGNTFQELHSNVANMHGIWYVLQHIHEWQFWRQVGSFVFHVSLDMWLGSIIIGLVVAIISYVVCYRLVVWYRKHDPLFIKTLKNKIQQPKDKASE